MMDRPDYFIPEQLLEDLQRNFQVHIQDLGKCDADRHRLIGQQDVVLWIEAKLDKQNKEPDS